MTPPLWWCHFLCLYSLYERRCSIWQAGEAVLLVVVAVVIAALVLVAFIAVVSVSRFHVEPIHPGRVPVLPGPPPLGVRDRCPGYRPGPARLMIVQSERQGSKGVVRSVAEDRSEAEPDRARPPPKISKFLTYKIMKNEKNNGTAFSAEKEKAKLSPSSLPVSASEKAAYEVFKRGDISRATIEGWLRNDLRSVHALVSEILHDDDLFTVLSDKYYARYRDLVEKQKLDQ